MTSPAVEGTRDGAVTRGSRGERSSRLRRQLLIVVAVVSVLLAVLSRESRATRSLERQSIDARFQLRGRQKPNRDIAIVALDDVSLGALHSEIPIPRRYYARLLDRVRAARPRVIGVDIQFVGAKSPKDDRALLAAISRDRPVVITVPDSGGAIPVPTGSKSAPGAILASAGVDTDPDNVLRRMMYAQVALPTLAVRVAGQFRRHAVNAKEFPNNHAWIDFSGPPGTFATYPMVDVLRGRVPVAALAGKAVLIGVTAPIQKDVFVTGASSIPMSGTEVQANALATILDGVPLRPAPAALDILLIVVLGVLPSMLASRLGPLYVLGAS